MRRSIIVYLTDSGFEVMGAGDCEEGRRLFHDFMPDVVLLDLRMPRVDGLEFLSIVKKESPETPVIIVSGAGVLQDAIEAFRKDAFDFITKPIMDMAVLENSVKRALERSRLIAENLKYHEHLETEIQKRTVALKERTLSLEEINKRLMTEMDDRRRIDDALRQSETRFRELADLLPQTIFEIDHEARFIFTNRHGLESFGYDRIDFDGSIMVQDVFAPEDRERVTRNIQKILTGEKPGTMEYTARHSNGMVFPVIVYASPVVRYQRVVGIRGIIFDLTDIKRTEKDLRESQSRLSAIIEVFEGFIYTCTSDYTISFMNKKMMDSVTGRDAVGEICHKALYNLNRPCPWCQNKRIFRGETIRQEIKSPVDGRWYYSINTPISGSSGRIKHRQSIIIDITDRKTTEEALRESAAHLREENIRLRSSLKEGGQFGHLVGKTPQIRQVYETILKAAMSTASVIIYGESGTGKELVARTIHEMSKRCDKKMITVNCGAIPDNLIESEFFGYRKGAFTGATQNKTGLLGDADGGTLFLDEVGDINSGMQVKLLRVIAGDGYTPLGSSETIKPDIRIIAATNKNLSELINKGEMREDFFYRINVIPIHVPPLRRRREDIPLLVNHFLQKYAEGDIVPAIPPNIMKKMQNNQWRGNVRELENAVYRYIALQEINIHEIDNQDQDIEENISELISSGHENRYLKHYLGQVEKKYILKHLNENHWHRKKVARVLGIDRRTLFRKMKDHGIC